MTLILALKGKDCVVLAADAQAMGGDPEHRTLSSAQKLGDLHGRIGYGCAGSVGLRQRVVQNLESQIEAEECGNDLAELRPKLLRAVNSVQREGAAEHVHFDGGKRTPKMIHVLFAGVSDRGAPWIYEVTWDGDEEEHRVAEAIGAGRVYATTALLNPMRHGLGEQSADAAGLLAYRVVNDVAVLAPDVGLPVTMRLVEQHGTRRVSESDLRAVRQRMIGLQKLEAEVFREHVLGWSGPWRSSTVVLGEGESTESAEETGIVPPDAPDGADTRDQG